MANTAAGALVVCPFYLSDTKLTISCEGLTEKEKLYSYSRTRNSGRSGCITTATFTAAIAHCEN